MGADHVRHDIRRRGDGIGVGDALNLFVGVGFGSGPMFT